MEATRGSGRLAIVPRWLEGGGQGKHSATPKGNGGDGMSAWDDLTSMEYTVACLAVGGFTNREIGAHLDLSRFAVNAHVRSVYRKLGVASRLELTDAWTVELDRSVGAS